MYIIIVGCGRVGSTLAQILSQDAHDVVIIDKEQDAFRRLGDTFNGLTLCGNGVNYEFLKTAGIEKAGIFCALTNGDNTNIMAAQIAKKIFNVPRVFARVYDPNRAELFRQRGIEVISGTMLIAKMIRAKILDSKIPTYVGSIGDLELVKIEVKGDLIHKNVKQCNIPGEFALIAILRKGRSMLPQPNTVLEEKDILFGLVTIDSLPEIKKKYQI